MVPGLPRNFQQLLMTDEREDFTRFIKQSTEENLKPEKNKTTPPCLRVSLQGTNGIRVGVDLWHVPMPDMFGKEGPHHLIALREDSGTGCLGNLSLFSLKPLSTLRLQSAK